MSDKEGICHMKCREYGKTGAKTEQWGLCKKCYKFALEFVVNK
jgi:hypothetical protein